MEFELENGKHAKQNLEVKNEDDKPLLEGISLDFSISSPSVSSSSSSSSSLELDAGEMSPLNNSPGSTSSTQTGVVRNNAAAAAQTKSPPVQTMGRPGEYDPSRIPTSIFSSKPSNPTECWSNESLFSIHMGNNSFSQDHAILFGKSGEFPRVDDWYNSLPNSYETKPTNNELSSSLPPVMEVHANEENIIKPGKVDSDQSLKVAPAVKVATPEIVTVAENNMADAKAASPNLHSPSTPHTLFINPRLSDESGNSGSSFAFPVLVSDSCKSHGSGKSHGSVKVVVEEPEKSELNSQVSKPSTPKAIPTTMISWFSCFWWRRCC